jgi:predicted Rossmann fold flavoprotein
MEYDVLVVGGGSAGLMAAGRAAELGKRVLLLEKNKRLGEKLRISGGGRCNITNAEEDAHKLMSAYGTSAQFLFSTFSQFGNKDTFTFFESKALPLVVQARKRAFPKTEKALDVVKTLEEYVHKGGVTVKTGAQVTGVESNGSLITGVTCGPFDKAQGKQMVYTAKEYIFAAGSVSHPETGSTGDGFKWLQKLGHTVVEPTPTIVPIKVADEWVPLLAGTSLTFMKITFFVDEDGKPKKKFSKTGKILFTHFGLSGPLILNSASQVSDLLYAGAVTATIDAYPHTDLGALEKTILEVFDTHKNKALKNVVAEFVPAGTAKGILKLLETQMDVTTKVHSVSRDERKGIARLLKALPLTIEGLMGFDRAVIADGGVPLSEVDTRTMRSKKVPNLFIIGDLLHINRPSGGYSLQLCWSTGFVAGSHA